MIVYNKDKDTFEVIKNNTSTMWLEAMFQNLLLWKGENPLDAENGIDFKGIFEQSAYLPIEVENVANEYYSYFDNIEVKDFETIDSHILSIKVAVTLQDKVELKSLEVSI